MAATFLEVLEYIRNPKLDPNDLNLIIKEIKAQTRLRRSAARNGLRVGHRVTFTSRTTGPVFGVVIKVNPVNVDVVEEGTHIRWRVSPSLLKHVDDNGNDVIDDEF